MNTYGYIRLYKNVCKLYIVVYGRWLFMVIYGYTK